MQTELEASFIYEDTPDQSKATADVKKDMESSAPMDRLVCGDVEAGAGTGYVRMSESRIGLSAFPDFQRTFKRLSGYGGLHQSF